MELGDIHTYPTDGMRGLQRAELKAEHYVQATAPANPVVGLLWMDTSAGASQTDQQLVAWADAEQYEVLSLTYDTTYPYVLSTATVKWPDGSAGTFTTTSINTTWEAIDAFTVSHTASGRTVTQSAVTRNSNGLVTIKPAMTVA